MTTETPWQQRLIVAADIVTICMITAGAMREKLLYAILGLVAFSVGAITRYLYSRQRPAKIHRRRQVVHH